MGGDRDGPLSGATLIIPLTASSTAAGDPAPAVTDTATVTFVEDRNDPMTMHFSDPNHLNDFNSTIAVGQSWVEGPRSFFFYARDQSATGTRSVPLTAVIWNSVKDWPGASISELSIVAPTTPSSSSDSNSTPVSAPTQTSASSGSIQTSASIASITSTASAKPQSDNGLSSGAVAGVAIGCLIAGALIAGVLVWFCLGKARKRRKNQDHESSALALMNHGEKGATSKTMSVETGSPISQALENGLPQPLEDKAISGEISKISNLIKNHVQSYYHTGRVSPALVDLDDLQALGNDLPISTGTLSTLLGNSDTREIALRFCIAWIMISRMQLHSDPNVTFFPPEIARSFQSMAYVDRGSRVQTVYLARWRALTAELMQSTYVRNAFSASDPRSRNIVAASDVLDGILRPYADSRIDNGQRQRNLDEILKRAATFAFTLFSQPSSWDYDWQDEQGVMSGSLCVFPALVQITDETGEPVKPPRAFSEAVVRRLDG